MEIFSVEDREFKPYGRVITGHDRMREAMLSGLSKTEMPKEGTVYVTGDPLMESLPEAKEVSDHLFGGMPCQIGWCNGRNTKLNCLEYHRDSEFNLGTEDFILLLAKIEEIEDGTLDTSKVKAFRVPAGTLVEIYATTLHYAPCHTDPEKGFRVMAALPRLTNTEKPDTPSEGGDDRYLRARNKWLLAHAESAEAKDGAEIALTGKNIDLAEYI